MKTILMIIIVLSAATIIGLTIFLKNGSQSEAYFYQQLPALLENNNIKLSKLTNFEWDEVKSKGTYSATEEHSYLYFYKGGKEVASIVSNQQLFSEAIPNGLIEFGYMKISENTFQNIFDNKIYIELKEIRATTYLGKQATVYRLDFKEKI